MPRQPAKSSRDVLQDRGVYMISVAAELTGMHPQTLRVYEARSLIKPKRSPKGTRLYSQQDVETLKRIHELTTRLGLNLAGVERVLVLEQTMAEMQAQVRDMQRLAVEMEREMLERVAAVHRSYKRELVPWKPPEQAPKAGRQKAGKVSIKRDRRGGGGNAARQIH